MTIISAITLLQEAEKHIQADNWKEGLKIIRASLASSEFYAEVVHFALSQFNAKRFDVAEDLVEMLLQQCPDNYDVVNFYGVILKNQKRYEEAILVLERAYNIDRSRGEAPINISNIYMKMQQYNKVLECCSSILEYNPIHIEAMRLQAVALTRLHDNKKAADLLLKMLEHDPNNIVVIADLSVAYCNQKLYDKALLLLEGKLSVEPGSKILLTHKADVLKELGRGHEAIAILEKLAIDNPKDLNNLLDLANGYYLILNDFKKSAKCYEMLYKQNPDDFNVIHVLCSLLLIIGGGDDERDNIGLAVELAKKLLTMAEDKVSVTKYIQAAFLHSLDYESYNMLGDTKARMQSWVDDNYHSLLLLQMSRVESMQDRVDLLEAHRVWGEKAEKSVASPIIRKVRQRLDNKTRIGLCASGFSNGAAGYSILPIVEYIDKRKFEVYCYSAVIQKNDATNKLFREKADSYKVNAAIDISRLAQSMADDHLDIAFDINGLTSNSGIGAFIYRPAPVQVTWFGYPHSVGLPTAMDYILLDPYIKPDDDRLITEKPFMLPETWVTLGQAGFNGAPAINGIPEDKNGYITFGSLNAMYKYTPKAIATWAEIMKVVPNSRFLCVRPDTASKLVRDNFCKHMAEHDITPDRISFIATSVNHLDCYNYIDISLDTFPHTGGTTTCESLWMGVPVVTLVGPCFFERISYSNLNNSGLGDMCAFSVKEYKEIALQLVADKEYRRYLRSNLREQILQHPLGQSERFVQNFSNKVSDALGRS